MDNFRRTGRTTKIVDKIIDELFKNGEAICKDHYDSYESHKRVAGIVWTRLLSEHNQQCIIHYDDLIITLKIQN